VRRRAGPEPTRDHRGARCTQVQAWPGSRATFEA
jgi:hypothetical protein